MAEFSLRNVGQQSGYGDYLQQLAEITRLKNTGQGELSTLASQAKGFLGEGGEYKVGGVSSKWMPWLQGATTLAGMPWLTAGLIAYDAARKQGAFKDLKSKYSSLSKDVARKYKGTRLEDYISGNVASMGSQFGQSVSGKKNKALMNDLISLGTLGMGKIKFGGDTVMSRLTKPMRETIQSIPGLGIPLDLASKPVSDLFWDYGPHYGKEMPLLQNLTKNLTMSDLYRPGKSLISSLLEKEDEAMVPGAPQIQVRGPRRII